MTIAYIMLFSTMAIVIAFFFRRRLISSNFLFFAICLNLFVFETIMFLTSFYHTKNHIIANINTLIYYPLAVLLVFNIWGFVKGKSKTLSIFQFSILGFIAIGWIIENFVIEDFGLYNTFLTAFVSMILVLISIYLINVIIFVKSTSIIKDSDTLLLIGMLIRSFFSGLILFINYRMNYSNEFYRDILILVNLAYTVANVFFLFSIICLPKNKKYTWPF